MSTGKTLLGMVAGIAAGAVLGILFAPEKGSVTRNQISQKGEDLIANLKSKFDEFLANATNEMEEVKGEGEDLMAKGKDKAQQAKHDFKNMNNPL